MQKHLLPVGFYDLLGDEASINQETINVLLDSFYAKKYQLIKTPLVEFEESFSVNSKDEQSFKMIDNFSGKTLVLRSDITPQIARLMATRLRDIVAPIRLCYVGDVLKIRTDNLYADRQLTQVGIELIGDDSCRSNLEVIELTLSSLKKIKLPNLALNFCCPQFLDILLEQLDIDCKEDLKTALATKNISAIKNLGKNYADDLIKLVLENFDFAKINSVINNLPIDQKTRAQLDKWQETINDVKKSHKEINFSVDIFGDDEFSYHNQIGFTIFAGGFSYPIARGGRYLINDSVPAIGATIYINNLRKILAR
ncbi:MAG: phosphoribosyltransferase regulatory subunit [Rickettsiaceae bacterium]|jgi:ATP phosphoribosyltransferase regulatory subunit|nr:phosphoribosyltransferase regulatory subunit [Rickettsiaceae bacterium]